jgi:uncharacterized membrane-anchored protein
MKTIHIVIIFIVVALAQLFIPAQMIYNQEQILKTGTAYKFKTQPVDPSDPFKGKYIFLNYEVDHLPSKDSTWTRQEIVYVTILNDSQGFVKAANASREAPKTGDYVKAHVNWYDYGNKILNFSFPFNEFYMEETKAYAAELAYTDAQRDALPNNTYALVYVKEGETVLDNVFINNIPIAKFVEE